MIRDVFPEVGKRSANCACGTNSRANGATARGASGYRRYRRGVGASTKIKQRFPYSTRTYLDCNITRR